MSYVSEKFRIFPINISGVIRSRMSVARTQQLALRDPLLRHSAAIIMSLCAAYAALKHIYNGHTCVFTWRARF